MTDVDAFDAQTRRLQAEVCDLTARLDLANSLTPGSELAEAKLEVERLRAEVARLTLQLECNVRDPAHENCRNAEAQLLAQLAQAQR